MRKTLLAVAILTSLFPIPVRAVQPLTMRPFTPVQDTLEGLASGDCTPSDCFDGRPILRREFPLVILEEKKIDETIVPPYVEHRRQRRVHCHRGRYGDGPCYDYDDEIPVYHPGRIVKCHRHRNAD